MVDIAQLVERQIVVLDVKGSNPSIHPRDFTSVIFTVCLCVNDDTLGVIYRAIAKR